MTQKEDIQNAVNVMKHGGIIIYPTDTVWGIGCDATNAEAVAKIYKIKRREDSKALICLVDSEVRLQRYVRNVPEVAWQVMEYADKPTTVILDNAVNLAPNLIAEDGSIAMRITHEVFSKELCFRFQKPIVSTSVNISGETAAQNFRDISPELIEAADYVCFSRRQEHKPHAPSSIIKIKEDGEVTIIRK
ncbi:L-threonylcarbamoyladenylate synthase [Prevotella sp. OH937_COT-195]|uniref:L-threonylcarbamoyladenylate synthase n=1 Tax=Prevotella sp. OH937_COT-195 TaxID=2491051 RepID=UPI000F64DCBE|nr:L-threonylcarbamoyladenylate synthase [Prevotella sp. OH937_COT-195]RRD03054.1 threonylcarbamoyl-AMP synthase [Prevotella sp. OH937_COT-195]